MKIISGSRSGSSYIPSSASIISNPYQFAKVIITRRPDSVKRNPGGANNLCFSDSKVLFKNRQAVFNGFNAVFYGVAGEGIIEIGKL